VVAAASTAEAAAAGELLPAATLPAVSQLAGHLAAAYPHLALPRDPVQLQQLLLQQQQQQWQQQQQQQQQPGTDQQEAADLQQDLHEQQQQQPVPSFAELLEQDWQQRQQVPLSSGSPATAAHLASGRLEAQTPAAAAAAAADVYDLYQASDGDGPAAADESPSPSPVPLLKRLQLVRSPCPVSWSCLACNVLFVALLLSKLFRAVNTTCWRCLCSNADVAVQLGMQPSNL
jgi:hypothetical protein